MKKFISEFKEFALKGNVLDLAIGVVIGTAFSAIVNSAVNDIIMPIVGILIGGRDFTSLILKVGEAQIKYGCLIQNVVNFFIIALFLFCVIKAVNKFKRKKEEEPTVPEIKELDVLKEINDTLKELKNK